jgi:hypothetical protein
MTFTKPKLNRAEGFKLCKLMSGMRNCTCEIRNERPCQALVMHLRAGEGSANKAFDIWKAIQRMRNQEATQGE